MNRGADQPLRSALYLPASNRRAIDKGRTLIADAVIFDLEDAVAPGAKPEARQNLEAACVTRPVARGVNVVRVNAAASGEFAADLKMVRKCRPHAILVPKISTAAEVATTRGHLASALGANTPALWGMIENCPRSHAGGSDCGREQSRQSSALAKLLRTRLLRLSAKGHPRALTTAEKGDGKSSEGEGTPGPYRALWPELI